MNDTNSVDCLMCGGSGERSGSRCAYCDPASALIKARVELTRLAYYAARDASGADPRNLNSEAQCEAASRAFGYAAEYATFIHAALAWDLLVRPSMPSRYAEAAKLITQNKE